jgi:hypothetical protein
MILSSDDMFTPNAFKDMYEAITEDEHNVMVYGSVMTFHDNVGRLDGPTKLPDPDYDRLMKENYIGFAVLIDRSLAHPEPDEGGACDWGLWLKIFDHCERTNDKIIRIDEPLYIYRIHEGQVTFSPERKNTMPRFGKLVKDRAYKRRETKS